MPKPGGLMNSDPRFIKGIEHFNKREFYDAHETWEDLWHEEHGEAHNFLQGLIQLATSLHHFEDSNLKGTRLLYMSGVDLLRPYGDIFWGIQLGKLVKDMDQCCGALRSYQQEDLPGRYHPEKKKFALQLNPELIPKIERISL